VSEFEIASALFRVWNEVELPALQSEVVATDALKAAVPVVSWL